MEAPEKGTFILGGRVFPTKPWYNDKALRKTYICLSFVILTSVCRSLFPSSQLTSFRLQTATMAAWLTDCKRLPRGRIVWHWTLERVSANIQTSIQRITNSDF